VLRLQEGDTLELINGKGWLAKGTISSLEKDKAFIEITSSTHTVPTKPQVTLALAILKASHLEYALEKAAEVGAYKFELFFAEKSEKKGLSDQYKTRLYEIVKNACKQCGRLFFPEITIKKDLAVCLETVQGTCFFGDPQGKTIKTLPPFENACLFVGPESGFSQREKELLLSKNAQGISFHTNTLRAETAAVIGTYFLLCHG
jgi:16S rRNA (uracil1498-N3)-methyltransferase